MTELHALWILSSWAESCPVLFFLKKQRAAANSLKANCCQLDTLAIVQVKYQFHRSRTLCLSFLMTLKKFFFFRLKHFVVRCEPRKPFFWWCLSWSNLYWLAFIQAALIPAHVSAARNSCLEKYLCRLQARMFHQEPNYRKKISLPKRNGL